MATGMFPSVILLYFLIVWLRRRRFMRRRSFATRNMARRLRIVRTILIQKQQMVCFIAFLQQRFASTCLNRSIWMKYRSTSFFTDVVSNWSDREWKQNFHISCTTFRFLCRELAPYLLRSSVVRDSLPLELR